MTSPMPAAPSPWMTREETAEYLRVKPRTVDRLVREKKLTRFVMEHGQHPRFRRAEVASLIVLDERVGDPTRAPQTRKAAEVSVAVRAQERNEPPGPEDQGARHTDTRDHTVHTSGHHPIGTENGSTS